MDESYAYPPMPHYQSASNPPQRRDGGAARGRGRQQDHRPNFRQPEGEWGGRRGLEPKGRGRGAVKEQVSFTVHVHEPFEIFPGMECRAMYYVDESFYHAVVVGPSPTGWYIAFAGFEDDGLQDTKVADILAANGPVGNAWIWHVCEALYYPEQKFYPAYCGPGTGSGGHLVAFIGFEGEPLQDTAVGDIAFQGQSRGGRQNRRMDNSGYGWQEPSGMYAQNDAYQDSRQPRAKGGGHRANGAADMAAGAGGGYSARAHNQQRFAPAAEDRPAERQQRPKSGAAAHRAGSGDMGTGGSDTAGNHPPPARSSQGGGGGGGKGKQKQQGGKGGDGDGGAYKDSAVQPQQQQQGGRKKGGQQQASGGDDGAAAQNANGGSGSGKGGKGKEGGGKGRDGKSKGGAGAAVQQQQHGEDGVASEATDAVITETPAAKPKEERVLSPPDCVVVVRGLHPSVSHPNLHSFCSKTVGLTPKAIRLTRSSRAPGEGRIKPSRALLIFENPAEASEFIVRAEGQQLKHRKIYLKLLSDTSNPPAAAGREDEDGDDSDDDRPKPAAQGEAADAAAAAAEIDGGAGDAEAAAAQASGGAAEGAEEGGAASAEEVAAEGEGAVQVPLGSVYEAVTGPGMLSEAETKPAEEAELTFGLCFTPAGRAVLQVLRQDGSPVPVKSLNGGGGGRIKARNGATVAVAVPAAADLALRAQTKSEVESTVAVGAPLRVTLVDDLLAAAVEFVDGWYSCGMRASKLRLSSNVHDASGMPLRLFLVKLDAAGLEIGVADVGPGKADVISLQHTSACSQTALLHDIAEALATAVQEQARSQHGVEAERPPADDAEFLALARQAMAGVGTGKEWRHAHTLRPAGREEDVTIDLSLSLADLIRLPDGAGAGAGGSGALRAAREMAEGLAAAAASGGAGGEVPRCIAPVGACDGAELVANALQDTLGVEQGHVHYFLQDLRNVAAGAARAALWLAPPGDDASAAGEHPAAAAQEGGDGAAAAAKKSVVKRCLQPYVWTKAKAEGEGERLEWTSRDQILPLELSGTVEEGVERLVVTTPAGAAVASASIVGCEHVTAALDADGLLALHGSKDGAASAIPPALEPRPALAPAAAAGGEADAAAGAEGGSAGAGGASPWRGEQDSDVRAVLGLIAAVVRDGAQE